MKKLILTLLFSFLVSLALADEDHARNDKWLAFKKRHGKMFKSTAHEQARFKKFMARDKLIDEHNKKHANGEVSYELGHNQFSDMDEEEIKQFRGIPEPSAQGKKARSVSSNIFYSYNKRVAHNVYTRNASISLPTSFNWLAKGWNVTVRNQGSCGSCWAFSTIGAIEAALKIRKGITVDLSEQKLVNCAYEKEQAAGYQYGSCKGGWMYDAMDYIIQSSGIVEEATLPYATTKQNCTADSATAKKFTISNYYKIQVGDEAALKEALVNYGPVSICLDVSPNTFSSYKSGIWDGKSSTGTQCSATINHAMLLVGYGNENGTDYWLIRNSWGSGWGEKGHIKVKANGSNLCGITSESVVPVIN